MKFVRLMTVKDREKIMMSQDKELSEITRRRFIEVKTGNDQGGDQVMFDPFKTLLGLSFNEDGNRTGY
ncbi:hypothetical protein ACOME3_007222 [Neoechinorhynchus agilis]